MYVYVLLSLFSKLSCFNLLDDWIMFDDDKVAPIKSEDVLKLSGGGK